MRLSARPGPAAAFIACLAVSSRHATAFTPAWRAAKPSTASRPAMRLGVQSPWLSGNHHADHSHQRHQRQLPKLESSAAPSALMATADAEPEMMDKPLHNPKPALVSMIQALSENNENRQMTVMMGATMALMFALLASPLQADAAMSGGRMGGSFSSPRSSTSMSRPMRSSSPRVGGYSRGGYGYTRPRTIIAPTYSPIITTPGIGYAPAPVYYGGAGVMAVSRGPSFFDFLFFGGVLYVIASAARSFTNSASNVATSTWGSSWGDNDDVVTPLGPGTSLVQVSIGMEVPNRDDPNSILSALKRLSDTAQTDSRMGVQSLTSQVAIELLRRKSSIVSASTSYQHYRNNNKALRDFQTKSVTERSKFEQEQVSKYGGVDYTGRRQSSSNLPTSSDKATMAVITIILAIDGDSTKVTGNTRADVEDALRRIAADVKVGDSLQSAEILWTPEDRFETLTLRDVVADYPELRSV